jgi:NADH-quinone oxidoreductase subunit C
MDNKNKPEREKPEGLEPAARKTPAGKPVPRGPSYLEIDDELARLIREAKPGALLSAQSFLDQRIYTVDFESLFEVMELLHKDPECRFDYLVDLTALDYLGDEKRFCMVYHLYSYETGRLIRVKSRFAEFHTVPTVTPLWETANWLEREVYDMFGIQFHGHPDLRRILLPEDWHGFPLKKDYDMRLQDQAWIKSHLRIRKVPE